MRRKKSFWYGLIHQTNLDKKSYLKLVHSVAVFVIGGAVASLVVFILLAFFGGFFNVFSIIRGAKLDIYALAFVSVLGGILLRFIKWDYYTKVLGLKVPFKKNLAVYFSLYSMTITPGNIGRVVAAYTLNRITNIKFSNIVPMVTIDIFTDFLGFAILAIAVAVYVHQYIAYIAIIDFVLLLPFVFILNDWLYKRIKWLLKKNKYIKMFTPYGEEYFESQNRLNNPKVYGMSLLVTLPAAFLSSMTVFFSLMAIGIVPTLPGSVFAYSTAEVFGMVTAVPGSIGVTDGSLVALLGSTFNLPSALSSAVTIMARFADLWFGVILGTVFLLFTLKYWNPSKKRSVRLRLNQESSS